MARSIAVGYDGSDHGRVALDFAVAEARRRDAALTLIHVVPAWASDVPLDPGVYVATGSVAWGPTDIAFSIETLATELAPDLETRIDVVDSANIAGTLIDRSETHQLLVVGSRGHGGLKGALLGSTSAQVATHAACPVIVTRPRAPEGPLRDSVVVGVDAAGGTDDVLRFAFEAAAVYDTGLAAVYIWQDPIAAGVGDMSAAVVDYRELADHADDALAAALEPWQRQYPDLVVSQQAVRGRTRQTLCDRAAGCELLVVGTHGHGRVTGALLGSVSQAVLHHAQAPVAVVRQR